MRSGIVSLLLCVLCAAALAFDPVPEFDDLDVLLPPFDDGDLDIGAAKSHGLLKATCDALHRKYPARTLYPSSWAYNWTNTDYWTPDAALGPACIFEPNNTADLAVAVRLLKHTGVPFAVKGGGHMPIPGTNNIGSNGILLSTSNFTQLYTTHSRSRLNIGVGNRWKDVYDYLMPYNKLVVGGRVGIVGVPGYFLGGGISFMANQHGWASSNVISFTGVLASGKVVIATAHNQYSDLFWALKGGGNSFAILTNIEVATYDAPVVTVGNTDYGTGDAVKKQWISALVNLAKYGNADPRHAVIPLANYVSGQPIDYSVMRFYNGQNIRPAIFKNLTAPVFVPKSDTFKPQALSSFVNGMLPLIKVIDGYQQHFYGLCIPATIEAVTIAHDTVFQLIQSMVQPHLSGLWVFSFTAMPMPTSFISNAIKKGGDPMGLTLDFGPTVWLEFSHTFKNVSVQPIVTSYLKEVDKELRAKLTAAGHPAKKYIYLNDADGWQDVFAGYPQESVKRLKKIRQKYDPSRMFTKQMPGGFKVDP